MKNERTFWNKSAPSSLGDYFKKSKNIEIADIHFSFKNRKILNLLKERGKAILENNNDMKKKIENEINETKRKDHETITTPVWAYVAFANEKSYLRATEYNRVRIGNK